MIYLWLAAAVFVLFIPAAIFAQDQTSGGLLLPDTMKGLNEQAAQTADYSGYRSTSGQTGISVITVILQYLLSFLGVVFFALIIYAGFRWLYAGGNEDQLADAKKLMKNAVIGLLIIVFAYLITFFVVSRLGAITGYEAGVDFNMNQNYLP
jgi:4-hydroxybenzoate polyprenyltransferase